MSLHITINAVKATIAMIAHRLKMVFLIRSLSYIADVGITRITSIVVDDGYETSR